LNLWDGVAYEESVIKFPIKYHFSAVLKLAFATCPEITDKWKGTF
jgi:hypothetical protein